MAFRRDELQELDQAVLHEFLFDVFPNDGVCLFSLIEITVPDHLVVPVIQELPCDVFPKEPPRFPVRKSIGLFQAADLSWPALLLKPEDVLRLPERGFYLTRGCFCSYSYIVRACHKKGTCTICSFPQLIARIASFP